MNHTATVRRPGDANAVEMVPLDRLRLDGGTQMRAETDRAYQDELAALFDEDNPTYPPILPPLTAFYDGKDYWLADGFTRQGAARELGTRYVPVVVKKGTQEDAVVFACGANESHGMRRTQADREKAVRTLLSIPKYRNVGVSKIKELCRVGHELAKRIREEMLPEEERKHVTCERGGTVYEQRMPERILSRREDALNRDIQEITDRYAPKDWDEPEPDDADAASQGTDEEADKDEPRAEEDDPWDALNGEPTDSARKEVDGAARPAVPSPEGADITLALEANPRPRGSVPAIEEGVLGGRSAAAGGPVVSPLAGPSSSQTGAGPGGRSAAAGGSVRDTPAGPARRPGDSFFVKDELGIVCATAAAHDAFCALDHFDQLERAIRQAARLAAELASMPGAELYRRQLRLKAVPTGDGGRADHYFSADLANALREVQNWRPYSSVCPYCHQQGRSNSDRCELCHGLPYVTKKQFDMAEDALKRVVQALAGKGGPS